MITLRELFTKALLSIPQTDESLTLDDLRQGMRFKHRGGVYVFYNRHNEPLYVGVSSNVGKRVAEHVGGTKGNKDIKKYLASGNYIYVDVFYESNKMFQEVYESYLIFQLNPRFNVGKTGRIKL